MTDKDYATAASQTGIFGPRTLGMQRVLAAYGAGSAAPGESVSVYPRRDWSCAYGFSLLLETDRQTDKRTDRHHTDANVISFDC